MPSKEDFDIFAQIGKEIEEFNNSKVHIAGIGNPDSARFLQRQSRGYNFSQKDTLSLIDLYYNSKFETGDTDSEGQTKLFLNVCAFRADVASKMIDLDTKDFIWVPDDESSKWGSYLVTKEFKDWSRFNYFGELINEDVENLPKYGTIVNKRVGKTIVNVPIRTIVNQQNAKDLKTATHVIEVHEGMTLDDINEFPDWDGSGLALGFGETTTVYERYGRVPAYFYHKQRNEAVPKGKENKTYDCVVDCTLTQKKEGGKNTYSGTILFIEKVAKRPYEECHWKRQHGRWLGIGEIENQFENQIARNMIANFRKRALQWSSKKIFQTQDTDVPRNLIRDVKDGEVLKINANGNITQIDMASREVGEFNSAEQLWEKNSDQKSFTFEVATGESMPSGTPFRLGVVLSNAVTSHFGFKREKLGLFFKRLIVEQVYKIFKAENSKAHTMTIFGTEKGIADLKKISSEIELNKRIFDWSMSDSTEIPDFDLWRQTIEESYKEKSHLFVEIPDDFYDDIKHHAELIITGEEVDTNAKIQTYTTLYSSMVQRGDPRAEQVLSKLLSLTGDNLESILGPLPPPQPQVQQQGAPAQQSALPQPSPQSTTV